MRCTHGTQVSSKTDESESFEDEIDCWCVERQHKRREVDRTRGGAVAINGSRPL